MRVDTETVFVPFFSHQSDQEADGPLSSDLPAFGFEADGSLSSDLPASGFKVNGSLSPNLPASGFEEDGSLSPDLPVPGLAAEHFPELGSLTPRIYERRIAPVFLRQIIISYFS